MAAKKPLVVSSGAVNELATGDTIAPASLGSGTSDNTTFLRGDNTWATPVGGSGNTAFLRAVTQSTPDAGTIVFTIAYTVGYIDVFQNGVKLVITDDFVATDGTSVTLTNATLAGDTVEFVKYPLNSNTVYTKTEVDTALSGKASAVANTGDETTASIKSKLGVTVLSGSNTGDKTLTELGGIPSNYGTTLAAGGINYKAIPGNITYSGINFCLDIPPTNLVGNFTATECIHLGEVSYQAGTYSRSIAIGKFARYTGNSAVSIGGIAGTWSTAIGGASANSSFSFAVGNGASANYNYTTAIGLSATTTGENAVAIGKNSFAAISGTAIGTQCTALVSGTSIGLYCTAGTNGVTIGNGSYSKNYGVSIGYGSFTGVASLALLINTIFIPGDSNQVTVVGTYNLANGSIFIATDTYNGANGDTVSYTLILQSSSVAGGSTTFTFDLTMAAPSDGQDYSLVLNNPAGSNFGTALSGGKSYRPYQYTLGQSNHSRTITPLRATTTTATSRILTIDGLAPIIPTAYPTGLDIDSGNLFGLIRGKSYLLQIQVMGKKSNTEHIVRTFNGLAVGGTIPSFVDYGNGLSPTSTLPAAAGAVTVALVGECLNITVTGVAASITWVASIEAIEL